MKKYIVLSLLVFLTQIITAQNVIKNPKFGISTDKNVHITKIERTSEFTILSFHVKLPEQNWISIADRSYIQAANDTSKLFIIKSEGLEIGEKVSKVDEKEYVDYQLYFPKLETDVAKIDFREDYTGSGIWAVYDLIIDPLVNPSVIPEKFQGNWFSEKTGEWTFSLLDSIAIMNNKCYKYISATPKKKNLEVTINNEDEEITLFLRLENDNTCTMHTVNNESEYFTHNAEIILKHNDKTGFNTQFLQSKSITYNGYINGYTNKLDSHTGTISYYNSFTGEESSEVFKINDNGSFSTKLTIDYPTYVSIKLPTGYQELFLEPGISIFQLINSKTRDFNSLFMGKDANIQYNLNVIQSVQTSERKILHEIAEMSPEEYFHYVNTVKTEEENRLDSIQKTVNLNAKVFQMCKQDIEFRYTTKLLTYNQNQRWSNYFNNREKPDSLKKVFRPVKINISEVKKYLDLSISDSIPLPSNDFFSLSKNLKYTHFDYPQGAYLYVAVLLQQELENNGIELTAEEKEVMNLVKEHLLDNYTPEYEDSLSSPQYIETWRNMLRKKYNEEYTLLSESFYTENLKNNISTLFDKNGEILNEINTLSVFLSSLNQSDTLPEQKFNMVKQEINNSQLKEYLFERYYNKKAEIEISGKGESAKEETEGDKLFNFIVNKYKGNVIFVDFWATWCGPCRSGIEQVKPLKDELQDKKIVFLYITNQTSPKETYETMIKDIKGEHYRVSIDEWNYLDQKFGLGGIPHYALVGKDGNIVNTALPHMNNDEIKSTLLEELNK